jgi:hypothetical protein
LRGARVVVEIVVRVQHLQKIDKPLEKSLGNPKKMDYSYYHSWQVWEEKCLVLTLVHESVLASTFSDFLEFTTNIFFGFEISACFGDCEII